MTTQFGEIARRYEARAKAVRQIEDILTQYPELRDELFGEPPSDNGVTTARPKPRASKEAHSAEVTDDSSKGTTYSRIVAHFKRASNKPQTIKEVVSACGMKLNTVGHVVYHARKESFEKVTEEGVPGVRWRVKPEYLK